MIKQSIAALGLSMGLAALAGCSTVKPVDNVEKHPVPKGLSAKQVSRSIKHAAESKGWNATKVRPGLITADITVRQHYAKVKIPYSSRSYSILYDGSKNLEAKDGHIHRNYNKWVILLDKRIHENLKRATMR